MELDIYGVCKVSMWIGMLENRRCRMREVRENVRGHTSTWRRNSQPPASVAFASVKQEPQPINWTPSTLWHTTWAFRDTLSSPKSQALIYIFFSALDSITGSNSTSIPVLQVSAIQFFDTLEMGNRFQLRKWFIIDKDYLYLVLAKK